MPILSIVISMYNHLEQTQAMVVSLLASLPENLEYEVILVDDASVDGTRKWLEKLDIPHIRKGYNSHNIGYAKSCNTGVRFACGEYLALLNNDLIFEPGWLEPMLDVLQSKELNAGLVGNLQYRVADGMLDHAGVQLNAYAKFGHIQTLPDSGLPYTKVVAVTGACMLLRKADFDALGGFNEDFVNGCEDYDLCFKLSDAGKAIYVANTSRIRHHVSLSRNVTSLDNERNSRHLFALWRQKIKQELGDLWVKLLHAGPQAYDSVICGQLSQAFLANPHTASQVIAEAMLLRDEYRWARNLGDSNPNADIADRLTVQGLRYIQNVGGYAMARSAVFLVTGLYSTRNFYVCGHMVTKQLKRPIAITISVNGIQEQIFKLNNDGNFNVGIIDPILLQGLINEFKVEAHFINSQGIKIGDAKTYIIITHIVIDDRMINKFYLTYKTKTI